MKLKAIILFTALVLGVSVAHAFNFGNMMNPGDWFDDNDRDYYDRGYRGYGYGGGPYGYGGGPYGYGGGPYGYGGGPYGWGGGPYGGYGGYGGYPGAIVVTPSQGNTPAPPRPPE